MTTACELTVLRWRTALGGGLATVVLSFAGFGCSTGGSLTGFTGSAAAGGVGLLMANTVMGTGFGTFAAAVGCCCNTSAASSKWLSNDSKSQQ